MCAVQLDSCIAARCQASLRVISAGEDEHAVGRTHAFPAHDLQRAVDAVDHVTAHVSGKVTGKRRWHPQCNEVPRAIADLLTRPIGSHGPLKSLHHEPHQTSTARLNPPCPGSSPSLVDTPRFSLGKRGLIKLQMMWLIFVSQW